MEKSWYVAARNGDKGFVEKACVPEIEIETGYLDKLLAKTPQNNNILHIASQHNQVDFIKYVLTLLESSSLITLISQKNGDGETPLHIASRKGNVAIVHLIVNYCKMNDIGNTETQYHQREIEVAEGEDAELRWLPWRVRNLEGNTALHEAIIHGRVKVARYLVQLDEKLICFVNKHNETPMHLAAKCNAKDDKQLVKETIELMNKQNASLTYKACKCPTNEELLSMVKLVLNKNKASIYTHDEDGMTPLLRAASESNISLIHLIISEFPESTEVRDFNGQTILHLIKNLNYEDAKSLFKIPEILCLKDQQDYFGNTPAFVVIKDIIKEHQSQMYSQIGLLKALLTSSANFSIKNKEGISAAALIQQYKSIFSNVTKIELDDELKTISKLSTSNSKSTTSTISNEDEKLSMIREAIQKSNFHHLTQNINTLGNDLSYYGLFGGGNILHAILKIKLGYDDHNNDTNNNELLSFVEKMLETFPNLLCQGDSNGNTPLHIIVRDHKITKSFLIKIDEYFERCQQELLASDEEFYCSPWTVKNVKGNTPLHELLANNSSSNIDEIVTKLKYDSSLFEIVNNQDETPLHVLCGRTAKSKDRIPEEVKRDVLKAYPFGVYKRDKNNLTPLLVAAKSGNMEEVELICKQCPESAQLRDDKGKTFWHLIDLSKVSHRHNERKSMDKLLKDESIEQLLYVKDNDGNTPVKVALNERNYHLLKALQPYPNVYAEVDRILRHGDFDDQFLITIIRCANHLPYKLEKTICKILKQMPNKSFFGVLESEITAYSNSLAVIAVLLATIAFTAAFTVPGGFRQEHAYLNNNLTSVPLTITAPSGKPDFNESIPSHFSDLIGTPVVLGSNLIPFLTRAAYWVFMVSDVLTMCLSTFVIYCQLWIMKTTQLRGVLIDMSIFTLQISFYTIMITFMMGVYVTTLRVESSLAYLTLFVCSILMLFMNRGLFPTKQCFLVFATAYEIVAQTIEKWVKVCIYSTLLQVSKRKNITVQVRV